MHRLFLTGGITGSAPGRAPHPARPVTPGTRRQPPRAHGRAGIARWFVVATALLAVAAEPALADVLEADLAAAPEAGSIGDNGYRMPYHLDSVVGLILCAIAVAVAWAMNHRSPLRRARGIFLAAASCLGVAVGILALDATGALADTRPPLFPIDNAKPVLLRIHAALFLAGAVALCFVALGEARRQEQLTLDTRNSEDRFGLASRYFHWSIAFLFLLLVPMGIYTSMIPEHVSYRQGFYVVHKSLGLTVLLLAAARLMWIIRNPAPPLAPGLKRWERVLAHGAHYGLYFFLFMFPISGFMFSTYYGKLSHFFFWNTPLPFPPDPEAVKPWGLAHKVLLPYLFYLVILGHIAGALKHRFIDRQRDALRRMVC